VGRNDDVIKSSGYRISPFEVESVLMQHPAVVECAVTGVPDDIRGMVVKATIVLGRKWRSQAGEDLKKDIQTFVKTHTAPYKYPRVVEFVQALPKTISGKVRRVEIREGDLRSRLEQGLRKIHEALRPVFWSTHNVEWIDNVL
jgi:acetyl-CoA synthetase